MTARVRVLVQRALATEHDVAVVETRRRGHATRLAQGAAADGVDAVVVLGGDGTLNEAANGLAGTDTALVPLPGGSTNVFARTIGLPNDAIEAADVTVASLRKGNILPVGLGTVNGRVFLFHAGVGFDAAVVERVERHASAKRYLGHPLFIWATIVTWVRGYERSRPRFSVRDHSGSSVDGYFAIVFNTNPYTFLGNRPLDVAPDATLDRALTVVTIQSLRLHHLARLTASALSSGTGLTRGGRHVDYRADRTSITISSDTPFPYQVDGDHLGDVTELTFEHRPDHLRLLVPNP